MADRIPNKVLVDKCGEFVKADPTTQALDELLKAAIVSSEHQIRDHIWEPRAEPLAWLRGSYDNLFTRYNCEVTGVTQANPGVFTAESLDTDVTGHGYTDKDLVYAMTFGDDSMDELNERFYRINYVSSTTFSLLNLDGQYAVDTSSLDAWSTGGYFYHCGLLLPSAIEPTGGNVWERWKIKDVFAVTFDSYPAEAITEGQVLADERWMRPGGQPTRWNYWRNDYQGFGSTEHFLRFYPPTAQRHNIRVFFEKSYPDISKWEATAYPPHIPEIHDCIWRRALSILATNSERARRESKPSDTQAGRLMGQIEVLYAQHWKTEAAKDERLIMAISRKMLGLKQSAQGFSA